MAALAVLALPAAGCGGNGGGGGTTAATSGGGAATGQAAEGRELFVDRCSSCHTLAAADASGHVGPNLDDLKPDRARVLAAIHDGPGAMPSSLVTGAQAEAVATFVSRSAGQ
ncbi:MAG: cytochrome c [Solirubrobacteraceae bacterium]